jgi:uncharacterized protein involved in exopolysaccharide biosynthesis
MTVHQERTFDDLRNTVHEYARIFRRRWRLALLGMAIVSSIAFWVSQYLPRQYRTSTLFERRDDVVLRNLVHSNSPYSFAQLKSSIALDMTGSRALAEAASAIGLLPPDAITSTEALTNEELRRLDHALTEYDLQASVRMVQSSPSLDTIELRCTANDPAIASRFVVALRDGYIRRTQDGISQILSSTRDFFAQEVERFQQQVNAADRHLKEQFAEFPGVDPSDPASAGLRLEALESERLHLEQRKAELVAQITARERFLTSGLLTESTAPRPAAAADPVAPPVLPETDSAIEKAIKQVEQQITDAIVVKQMTNEHPAVRTLQRKLDNLYAALEATRRPAPATDAADGPSASAPPPAPDAAQQLRERDPVLAGQRLRVELELDALRAQLEIAAQHLEAAETRAATFASLYDRLLQKSDEMKQVENQLGQDAATAVVWRQHLAQLERILTAESEDRGTQFSLIEEPKENTHAVKPRAASIFVVCLGCGLAAAALLIALAELLDRSFRSAGQITRSLSLPILECIPVINTPRVRRRQLVARLLWTPALCVLLCSLFFTASLAYASLERPELHRRAISKLDHLLARVGAPSTSLGNRLEE